jgi:hypothetical protein
MRYMVIERYLHGPGPHMAVLTSGDHALLVEAALPVCAEYGLALAGGYPVE